MVINIFFLSWNWYNIKTITYFTSASQTPPKYHHLKLSFLRSRNNGGSFAFFELWSSKTETRTLRSLQQKARVHVYGQPRASRAFYSNQPDTRLVATVHLVSQHLPPRTQEKKKEEPRRRRKRRRGEQMVCDKRVLLEKGQQDKEMSPINFPK